MEGESWRQEEGGWEKVGSTLRAKRRHTPECALFCNGGGHHGAVKDWWMVLSELQGIGGRMGLGKGPGGFGGWGCQVWCHEVTVYW